MSYTTSHTHFGANYNKENGLINFTLFSKNGTAAILCIFDKPKGAGAILNIEMEKEGDVFSTAVSASALEGFVSGRAYYYGYRVFGPNYEYTESWVSSSKEGFRARLDNHNNRFNPNKLAYDPYSRELSHLQKETPGDCLKNYRSFGEDYFTDNALMAPKSVLKLNDEIDIGKTTPRALKDEIIAEVHLRSLTKLWSGTEAKGTYKGAGEFAKTLKSLGVTMVEFLPLYEFDENEGIGNYWGYMPLCCFAPHKKYAFNQTDGEAVVEFRRMIRAFHDEDIKVCLDVVYNHTGEARIYNGNREDVNLFSYALIDNAEYYKSSPEGFYAINSGCHNDANTAAGGFKNIIVDSLVYWANQGVDAFRFDLAAALMDTETGVNVNYSKTGSIIGELKERLNERGITVNNPDIPGFGINLIAEPWTCGGCNAYQLGNFPECFAEWADISRNTIRAFSTRPHSLDPAGLRNLLGGFPGHFIEPFKGVNYVSCHDGFTLWDLNSYDKKSETTCGGSDWELCSSYGGNKTLRDRGIRNQMALLCISSGCFMTQVEDIFLHSKGGNNNSYNLDNEVNYINFNIDEEDEEKKGLLGFIKDIIFLRKNSKIFKTPEYSKNMEFFNAKGESIPPHDPFWQSVNENFLSFVSSYIADNEAQTVFAGMNKGDNEVIFKFPLTGKAGRAEGKSFFLVFDTKDNVVNPLGAPVFGDEYRLAPHTIVFMLVK